MTASMLLVRDGETVRFLNSSLRLDRYLYMELPPGGYEALVFASKDRSQSWTFTVEENE